MNKVRQEVPFTPGNTKPSGLRSGDLSPLGRCRGRDLPGPATAKVTNLSSALVQRGKCPSKKTRRKSLCANTFHFHLKHWFRINPLRRQSSMVVHRIVLLPDRRWAICDQNREHIVKLIAEGEDLVYAKDLCNFYEWIHKSYEALEPHPIQQQLFDEYCRSSDEPSFCRQGHDRSMVAQIGFSVDLWIAIEHHTASGRTRAPACLSNSAAKTRRHPAINLEFLPGAFVPWW